MRPDHMSAAHRRQRQNIPQGLRWRCRCKLTSQFEPVARGRVRQCHCNRLERTAPRSSQHQPNMMAARQSGSSQIRTVECSWLHASAYHRLDNLQKELALARSNPHSQEVSYSRRPCTHQHRCTCCSCSQRGWKRCCNYRARCSRDRHCICQCTPAALADTVVQSRLRTDNLYRSRHAAVIP